MGLLLGLRTHPNDGIDVSSQCGFNVFHHLQYALLAFRREIPRGVGLTQRFANLAVLGFNTPAPERFNLFCPKQSLSVERKIGIHEVLAQSIGLAVE